MNTWIQIFILILLFVFFSVLPPVLVPRYSEYPGSMPAFQQISEPSMPYNVSFPNGFQQGQGGQPSPGSSGPGSPYGLPGKEQNKRFLVYKDLFLKALLFFHCDAGALVWN